MNTYCVSNPKIHNIYWAYKYHIHNTHRGQSATNTHNKYKILNTYWISTHHEIMKIRRSVIWVEIPIVRPLILSLAASLRLRGNCNIDAN